MPMYRVSKIYSVDVEADTPEQAGSIVWEQVWEKEGLSLIDEDGNFADLDEYWSVELLESEEGKEG